MNKRLKIRPTLCATSSLRASPKTSPRPTLRGSIMVSVCPFLDLFDPLDVHGGRPIVGFVCGSTGSSHARALSRHRVRSYRVERYVLPPPHIRLIGILILSSRDACCTHQLGIHGRYPACGGSQVLIQPRQLDHYHRFVAQSRQTARSVEKTFRPRGACFRSGLCVGAYGASSSYPCPPDLVVTRNGRLV